MILRSINKATKKGEHKITRLSEERVIEKKREKAEIEHRIEEKKSKIKNLK